MTINIRGANIELTDAIRSYVEEKFSGLEKYEAHIQMVDVEVGKNTNHHNKGDVFSCSVHITLPSDDLKIERDAEDLYKAIDKVRDHFREALTQRKEKMIDERRNGDMDTTV